MPTFSNGENLGSVRDKVNDAIEMIDISSYTDAAAVLADTVMTYSVVPAGSAARTVVAGDIVRTRKEGASYRVAAPAATDHHVVTAGGIKLYVNPGVGGVRSADAFGASTSSADNSAVLAAMYASNPRAVVFDAFYPITGNFARPDIPHYGMGGVVIGGVNIPLSTETAFADLTVHVSPSGSDTANHGLTSALPFMTLNRAEKSLPKETFDRQQLVSMAAGTHNQSFTPAADMARAAILMPGQRLRRKRTDGDGAGDMEGAVVYRGQGVASTFVETNPSAGYGYGLYLTSAEAAFQDFTIRPAASGATQALSTVHRTAYGHFLRVNFDGAAGAGVGLGAIVEAGGFMEAVDCQFTGASSLDLLVYNPGSASIAGVDVATKIGKAQINGTCNLAGNVEVTGSISVVAGGYLSSQILGSLRPKISGSSFTVASGGRVYLSNTDITVPVTARGDMRLDACNITAPIIADGCVVRLNGVTTVGMTDPRPLVSINGGRFVIDSTSNIRNNASATIGDRTFVTWVQPNANGGVINIPVGKHSIVKISAVSANRTGWTFAATPSGGFPGQPFGHGDRLTVIGGGFSTQLLTGNGFTFPGGAIQVSRNIPGTYSGFEAIYDADGGYWLVTALGTLF